ncbi:MULTISPECIES: malto-oligosyltrehalose trehalohydrolase [Achromobacter]|uniref:Malto-oligosyltrehalose trehalohydrolase n=1 Tax=Achromobacter denitrificans TaxID=32002 RepID=A0A6N0JK72_ACHDE|nr:MULTISPECIES: malto-oligosyltrehalose trehalohydrolase [Achromobacter]QKQ47525.1 malto-oligosyltrehalose trehalohydrolase [Achromobacter denitrificans]
MTSSRSQGAVLLDSGVTRFRLWAPTAPAALALEVEGHPPIPLRPDADGYVQADVDCPPGARYHYRLDAGTVAPDPASRLQDGDVHGDSVVVAPDDYPWRHPDWVGLPWEASVIYETHVGLEGGYAALEARLPGLAALGVTLLELMPIADFPGPRNWGYDGVLPYAPDTAYGTPEALKRLIDTAHGLGMGVMLDVVYNHFGPDGNYLPRYAAPFFRHDVPTPWGDAIDFRQPAVSQFFKDNAVYWLSEFRFDGLRLDAVHAIAGHEWLRELAADVHARIAPERRVHLVLENDDNRASLLRGDYDAQWNDDAHHVLHHLLTGETQGYYADYAEQPAEALARCLAEGWLYQGQRSRYRGGEPRGEPSAELPPTAFVLFLQNHDQTGNRALGERLASLVDDPERLRAAVALQLLAPQIPLIFLGEECGSRAPFLYFTSHADPALAQAVRDGRRREFSGFAAYAEGAAADLPDPNDPATFLASRPEPGADADAWLREYAALLDLRARLIAPRLAGAASLGAAAIGSHAVFARWELADGARLTVYANLGPRREPVPEPLRAGADVYATLLFESQPGGRDGVARDELCGDTTVWLLEDPS